MKYLKPDKHYCFSPPVMIATFFIELGLALYALWRYKLNAVTQLVIAILVLLSVFQLAEYNVCEGAWGISSLHWAKLGYVAITLLPPLGVHLAVRLAKEKQSALVAGAYSAAVVFAGYFLFVAGGVSTGACLGNYVLFESIKGTEVIYTLYYYGLLILGVWYALSRAAKVKSKNSSRALRGLALGYLVFIVPTTTVNIIDPSTIAGIPSIMCGFAVLLAIILAFVVLPAAHRKDP